MKKIETELFKQLKNYDEELWNLSFKLSRHIKNVLTVKECYLFLLSNSLGIKRATISRYMETSKANVSNLLKNVNIKLNNTQLINQVQEYVKDKVPLKTVSKIVSDIKRSLEKDGKRVLGDELLVNESDKEEV